MIQLCRRQKKAFLGLTLTLLALVPCMLLWLRNGYKAHPGISRKETSRQQTTTSESDSGEYDSYHGDITSPPILGYTSDVKYLLPLLEYNWNEDGCWMEQMRYATQIAIHFNRTIATVPLRTHGGDTKSSKMVHFDSAFDGNMLSKVLNVVTVTDFREFCGSNLSSDSLVIDPSWSSESTWTELVTVYDGYRSVYEESLGILLPELTSISRPESEYQYHLNSLNNKPCVALYHPNKVNIEVVETEIVRAALGLSKAAYIRELVDALVEKLCGGDPFLAVHWRNKTGESCLAVNVCEGDMLEDVQTLIKLSPNISDAIIDYMNDMNSTCIYVSHPPFEQQILVDLKSKLSVERIITQADVTRFAEMKSYADHTNVISLIEQEICLRARVFLPWFTKDAWSSYVATERHAHGLPTKGLSDLPQMPKEALSFKWLL
ncbi:uncharacterized protein [Ptychodera flava]|uniref:uncharacterized protein n=1 Tax=Ptychodera flava TaxID=63121 RepID=UPI00396A7FED